MNQSVAVSGCLIATPFCPTPVQQEQQIPAHEIKPGCGGIFDRKQQLQRIKHVDRTVCDEKSEESHPQTFPDTSLKTKFEVYLYSSSDERSEMASNLILIRESNESLLQTLKRLLLKVKGKINAGSARKKKNPGSRRTPFDVDDGYIPTVLVGEQSHEQLSALDVSMMSNIALCQVSLEKNLYISLRIPDADDDASSGEKHLLLSFESFPPTVVRAETFRDFQACLFQSVPITLSVVVLYATASRVEWFANGVLEGTTTTEISADSGSTLHTFSPLESHVGKNIEVVVTPIRTRPLLVVGGGCRLPVHEGRGHEAAFRFSNLVSPIPHNSILDLRLNWLAKPKDPRDIRVVSYNILADQNTYSRSDRSQSLYPYAEPDVIRKERRLPLVLHEILQYQADVICLQEVDEFAFNSLLRPVLNDMNYDGFYSAKQSEGSREGCALFYSMHSFHPLSERAKETIIIRDIFAQQGNEKVDDSLTNVSDLLGARPDVRHTLLKTLGHIIQLVPLRHRLIPGSEVIWVANTHLFYHPLASHLRLLQTYLFSWLMSRRLSNYRTNLIVAGDLNSSVRDPAVRLLLDRSVPQNPRSTKQHLDSFRWDMTDDTRLPDCDFPSLTLPLNVPALTSAIQPEPDFTHHIQGFTKALDHVLISKATLSCHQSAPMPSQELTSRFVAMPSPEIPSDHVSLVCDLRLYPRGDSELA